MGYDDRPERVDEMLESDADEKLSEKDIVYHVATYGADYPIDGLIARLERGDIFSPTFQRNYVWTWPQASKFVESIILGLPVPSIFLYLEESTQKHLIVDGLQRLVTLLSFRKGHFIHNDRPFKLKEVTSRIEGRMFGELEELDRRRFENAIIHAMIIQQLAPEDDNSSAYHIFDRLNSSGTPPQPQEIRTAIYHGEFQKLLCQLNENRYWRDIFGPWHTRSKDQELILRFLALCYNRKSYAKPMKAFLNDFMRTNRHADAGRISDYSETFEATIRRAKDALGVKAFRPKKSLNVAVFDAMMVAIRECPHADSAMVARAYRKLLADKSFSELTNQRTADATSVFGRIDKAIEAINAAGLLR